MDIKELQEDTRISISEYLDKFQPGVTECVDFLRRGMGKKAFIILAELIDGLNWLIEAISLLERDEGSDILIPTNLFDLMKEMLSAMENGDHVLLADMLEYEISPLINEWKEKLQY